MNTNLKLRITLLMPNSSKNVFLLLFDKSGIFVLVVGFILPIFRMLEMSLKLFQKKF